MNGARELEYLEDGTEVVIHDLKARPDLNSKRGVVMMYSAQRERYQVKLADGEEHLFLRPFNVTRAPKATASEGAKAPDRVNTPTTTNATTDSQRPTGDAQRPPESEAKAAAPQPEGGASAPPPAGGGAEVREVKVEYLEPGTRVLISGLKARPDLNEKQGTVVLYAAERERYQVRVSDGGEDIYLRPTNLAKLEGGATSTAPPAAASTGGKRKTPEETTVKEEEGAALKEEEQVEEGAAEKAAIMREMESSRPVVPAGGAAVNTTPVVPIEEIKDSETLLKEFFADITDATRNAEVDRILTCFKLNPYEHLNLRFDCNAADINKAFRKISLMVHPDKCKHEHAKQAFDAIGQAQTLLSKEDFKKELDFNLERAREDVMKAWRKETRNDVVLRVRFQGNREAMAEAFVASDEYHERWKLAARKYIVDLEWRRRKLTLRIAAEEERVKAEEQEEAAERKKESKMQKNWNKEEARETRVGDWRDFMKNQKSKKKKQKTLGEFKAPSIKTEERKEKEKTFALEKERVLRPDEVSRAW